MITLLLATLGEAQPLLTALHADEVPNQPFRTFTFPAQETWAGGVVIISGMGPAKAVAATAYAIVNQGTTILINPGICGALSPLAKPGDIFRVRESNDGDALLRGQPTHPLPLLLDGAWRRLTPVRLATVTEPVFGGERRDCLTAHADVVDMEGDAVAQVCARHSVPCYLLKGVSDPADASGRETLHRNLATISDSVAKQVLAGLAHVGPSSQGMLSKAANFVKVEHTIFSLPLIFAGAWIGAKGQWPGLRLLALITLAGLGARALGMAMNRILDRRLDLLNPRTAGRELPSGRMSPVQAWSIAMTGLVVYLAACAALGPVCLKLSPIPAFVLITYSVLKRLSSLCHFGIGVCLALGPLGACVAVTGGTAVSASIVLLALFTFCWISGFDIIYALQDVESDRKNGIHSLPARLGPKGAQWMAGLIHLVAITAAVRLWQITGGGITSGLALTVMLVAFTAAYHQKIPLPVRFFPISAIAGIAGALIPLLGVFP